MLDRCLNEDNSHYQYYGGRGITVCDRWLESFENFLEDMGKRPDSMTLDRINVNGNYETGNCRWASRTIQQRNQRRSIVNSSGRTGVQLDRGKWVARIRFEGKNLYLGRYDDFELACFIREEAELKYYGFIKE